MSLWVMNGELQPPRACDRCHAVKERCQWLPDGTRCERCLRLQHICETARPRGRPGRKPGARGKRLSQERQPRQNGNSERELFVLSRGQMPINDGNTVPRSVSEFGDVPTSERQVVQRLLFENNLLDLFSISSSFRERVREYVIPHLMLSKARLLDGLLACAISWTSDIDSHANTARLASCYRYASSALATLASLKVTDSQTMIDCLTLGALVSTFALKLRLNDILAISGRTLGLIGPLYAVSDPARPEVMIFLSCTIMWELRGCLFSCGVPTLRFRPPAEAYADRHVGLCATLLPLFHDICKVSHSLAHGETDDMGVMEDLDAVEQSVRRWQPPVPEDFDTRFDGIDIAHMLCQAQVLHLAALLVTHRLRYPFGINDGPAQVLSMTILSQLEMTFAATKQLVRCIDIALLVACLELKEPERQKWSSEIVKFAGFSAQFGAHVQGTLTSFWAVMDMFGTISWSGLTALGAPFLRNLS